MSTTIWVHGNVVKPIPLYNFILRLLYDTYAQAYAHQSTPNTEMYLTS